MTHYMRNKDVTARSVAGAHLLIPLDSSARSVYTLNETGYWLWDLIAQPKSQKRLVEGLLKQYDALTYETAQRDVRAFLDDMLRMGLAKEVR